MGTTKKGIGPTYSSKATRNGIRIGELLGDFNQFSQKFQSLVNMYQRMFPSLSVDVDEELSRYKKFAERIRPLVAETVSFLDRALREGKKVLVEGANAAMLDIDFGKLFSLTTPNCFVSKSRDKQKWSTMEILRDKTKIKKTFYRIVLCCLLQKKN